MKQFIIALGFLAMIQSGANASSLQTSTAVEPAAVLGMFESVGQKNTMGDVSVEQRVDGLYLKFAANFKTDEGPDLRVVLRDSNGHQQMLILESLKMFKGQQEYKLPISKADLMKFDQVVIYCLEFHVDFGIAVF